MVIIPLAVDGTENNKNSLMLSSTLCSYDKPFEWHYMAFLHWSTVETEKFRRAVGHTGKDWFSHICYTAWLLVHVTLSELGRLPLRLDEMKIQAIHTMLRGI